nr:MAG TPA: hypothetical protein [Caudoviricetes sp.]
MCLNIHDQVLCMAKVRYFHINGNLYSFYKFSILNFLCFKSLE